MPKTRGIEMIYAAKRTNWVGDGFKVRNYFPSGEDLMERFSPFFLLDYNAPRYQNICTKRGANR